MANRKIKKWKIVVSILILCLLAVTLVFADKIETLVGYKQTFANHQTTKENILNSDYYVSYIDVGQGSSSYVQLPDGKNMLIDGGDKEFGETVAEFLDERNVKQIDYLIATHSDSDHIGGLNYILENYEVKTIYRPLQISMSSSEEGASVYEYEDLAESYEKMIELYGENPKVCKITTAVYRNFIKNIYSETYLLQGEVFESEIYVFYDGLKISGENYEIEFFGPLKRDNSINLEEFSEETKGFATIGYGSSSSFANDSSAIFTITCYNDKYLFMGDARFTESDLEDRDYSEWDFILSLTEEEKAKFTEVDVLLLPHHGSKYSTSPELLNLVLPRFAIVSAGADNEYGHPTPEVLERLTLIHSLEDDYLLRTDQMGDIVFSNIDGELSYYIEKQSTEEKLILPFKLLCVVIAVGLILFVFSIRPIRRKRIRY